MNANPITFDDWLNTVFGWKQENLFDFNNRLFWFSLQRIPNDTEQW